MYQQKDQKNEQDSLPPPSQLFRLGFFSLILHI